ncbi:hypothetical protein [Parasynechococcus sp.]|jgi:hypothetical protein|uniref:hypothetical protein n=1 Tax=Parasynechococcus sp. TaxID=3101203 RepID=UPI003703BD2D
MNCRFVAMEWCWLDITLGYGSMPGKSLTNIKQQATSTTVVMTAMVDALSSLIVFAAIV